MKRLVFKKPFNGLGTALNLIPESYKVDNKEFEMTDGNENYTIRWEGSLNEGEAIVTKGYNKILVNEDMTKMKKLMNYKSLDTLGTVKGQDRINENSSFNDIFNKTREMLAENRNKREDLIVEDTVIPMGDLLKENIGDIQATKEDEEVVNEEEAINEEGLDDYVIDETEEKSRFDEIFEGAFDDIDDEEE